MNLLPQELCQDKVFTGLSALTPMARQLYQLSLQMNYPLPTYKSYQNPVPSQADFHLGK